VNRDYALDAAYDRRISSLAAWRGLAFSCACMEHVMPMWQGHPAAVSGRAALECMWRAAFAGGSDSVTASRLRQPLARAIPDADDDPSRMASLVRIGGVMVIEALDFMATSDVHALCRCCGSTFDLLNYAVDVFLDRDPGWWEELGEFERADPVFAEEWHLHQRLLDEVEGWPDSRYVLQWRESRRERGRQLATYFRLPLAAE
jgi:hypothetical protein